ncbi:sortase [Patescibacteria group bacterium]|nr:sortase [Patescibacteria group bacterium]
MEIIQKNKKLVKLFVFLFLISFLIINWGDVSWVFNYRAVSGLLSDSLEKDQIEAIEAPNRPYFNKGNSIEIPKIGVKAPIVLPEDDADDDFDKALKKGVALYPQSALPGEKGTTIILGHSAPSSWPKINYYWVFNGLSDLIFGDEIFIYFNGRQYSYVVKETFFLDVGEEVPQDLAKSKSMLVLLSCWPPETGEKRIAVQSEFQF